MPISIAEINANNQMFWEKQSRRTAEFLEDPLLARLALERLREEEIRGIPLKNRLTLEYALELIVRDREEFSVPDRADPIRDKQTISESQSAKARLPRNRIEELGTTRDELIGFVVLGSENKQTHTKILWREFYERLRAVGLNPEQREVETDINRWEIRYRSGRRLKRISYKRFSNIVSTLRKANQIPLPRLTSH